VGRVLFGSVEGVEWGMGLARKEKEMEERREQVVRNNV
jgi:hypothetical protein